MKPPSDDEDEIQDEKQSESESEEKSPEKEVEGKCSCYFDLLYGINYRTFFVKMYLFILTKSFYYPFGLDVPKKVLTHKEKKELKKKQKMEAEIERITKKGGEGHSALGDNFTVAQALKTGGALVQLETAVDIKIDKFSIAAKGKDLFRDAALTIAQGRR